MFPLINKALAQLGSGSGSGSGGLVINKPNFLPDDICVLLDNVTRFLVTLVIPIAGLMIIWAAYQILTAGGDPAKFSTGRRTIVYALVGLGIVIISRGLVAIIIDLLGGSGIGNICP
ncbi:MAG: hypothetical protein A3E61_01520 [Candidatus Colwellbacteria bacterium RIFCSPHIGHO2_12_FULL_43_12]|uniref:TrbC/VirB2 family protein n=3 Tax=Candidatus Colwelliibacteriota TaxID=1817904 RepID=A0A1G1Z0H1_9BACT|nr:MAG: hypothetical protein A3D47_00305 [Candidatus Colwellbacteria bacterium RIFCSPHIGHO2_02_FULL_43_15]OGY58926.1 MAG: hypothetical protein A3E61_01520 [Candidatus Colwellbacteria bacterium RIFCSPHIGHO2_12_FULL_43_12]OGY61374.1 MAG: hypothetical protein A3F99_01065 [Candidatus Colwellbacteria bacterium RIFCSPLOWO2_12_FULL_43_11]